MKTIPLLLGGALLVGFVADAQSPLRSVYTVNTIAELESLKPASISSGGRAVVDVLGYYDPGDWGGRRQFYHDSTANGARDGGHVFTNAAGAGRWLSTDRRCDVQLGGWWGLVGDGVFDNAQPLQSLVAFSSTNAVDIRIARGVYKTSWKMRFRSNYPTTMSSEGGSYISGWLPSDANSEARFVYTGTSTDIFADFYPTAGLDYGLFLNRITFDANGRAAVAVRIKNATRGAVDFLRIRNSSDVGLLLDNSVYLGFQQLSISANELPFDTDLAVGVLMTNMANANTFIRPTISGTTNYAMVLANSRNNKIENAGIESNRGGGILYAADSNENGLKYSWFEANGDTNRYIVIASSAYHNSFEGLKFENGRGMFRVGGGHNSIKTSTLAKLHFDDSSGSNDAEEVLVVNDTDLTGNWRAQTLRTVKNYAATWYTNNVPENTSFRGDVLDLFNSTNDYPRTRIARDSIKFGDGLTGLPSVGWERLSGASVATRNTIVQLASGANDGLWSAYGPGDAKPQLSMGLPGKISIGLGGTNDPDINISRFSASAALFDFGILTVRPQSSDNLLSGYPTGSAQPTYKLTIDGTAEYGPGGTTPKDVSFGRFGAGEMRVAGILRADAFRLGGVLITNWPSGGAGSGTTVSVDGGAALGSVNLSDTSEIDVGTSFPNNAEFTLKTNGVSSGTYTGLVATVDSKGRITAAATISSAQLLSLLSLGTGLTNSAGTVLLNVVFGSGFSTVTNGSRITVTATASGGGGDAYLSSNQTFTATNTFSAPVRATAGVTLPTKSAGDNSTNAATTAYVDAAVLANTNFPAATFSNVTVTSSFTIPHTAYSSAWNGSANGADRDAVYDQLHVGDTDDDGLADKLDLSAAGYVRTTSGGVISTGSTSANLAADISDETGSGALVFGTAPTVSNLVALGYTEQDLATYAGTNAVADFATEWAKWTVTNNVYLLSSTNRPASTSRVRKLFIEVTGDTVDRTITYSSSWTRYGSNITTIPSNKVVGISLKVYGTNETGVSFGVMKQE